MKARSALALALAAGLLAGMAVAPAGAQWVDPPAPGSAPPAAPPRAEAPPPKPAAEAAKAEPQVEARPSEPARAGPERKPVQAAAPQERPAKLPVETTGSVARRTVERKVAPRRIAKPAQAGTRAAVRPAPRLAAKPSRERFAPRPEQAQDLEMVRIRTIELPDGREVDVVTRIGRSEWD